MKKQFLLLLFGLISPWARAQVNTPTLSEITASSIKVTWTPAIRTAYELERSEAGGRYAVVFEASGTGTEIQSAITFVNSSLSAGTEYCYRLRIKGTASYSPIVCATTTAILYTPADLEAIAVSSAQINLTWITPNARSGDTYEVHRADPLVRPLAYQAIGTAAARADGTGAYADRNLESGKRYCYRVKRLSAPGSGLGNEFCATTQASPPAPAAPVLSNIGPFSIQVRWTTVPNRTYELERSDAGGRYSVVYTATEPPNIQGNTAMTFANNGLTANTEYCYRVRIKESDGVTSAYSGVVCGTTLVNIQTPEVPQNVLIATRTASSITIFWSHFDGGLPATFEIQRATSSAGPFEKLADGFSEKLYTDNNLPSSMTYCYRVRAKNNGPYSAFSPAVCGSTLAAPVTAPVIPGRLAATAVSSSQINLSWVDASDNETGFELESSTDNVNWRKQDIPANQTTYSHTGLNASTRYYYQIRAVNSAGPSLFSAVADATTLAPPPGAPVNMIATAVSPTQINLTWTAPSAAPGDFYEVQRADAPGGTYQTVLNVAIGANGAGSYNDLNRNPATQYCYRVRRYSAPQSDFGAEVCATTQAPAPTVPNAPVRLSATAIAFNQINLFWAIGSVNTTGFEIEQRTDGTSFNRIATVGANVTTYQHTGLNGATKYYYRVRAINAVGPSDYSNVADATTPAAPVPPPSAPTGLGATAVSATQINLTWTNTATNATGYEVDQSPDGTGNWIKIGDAPANATTYQNTGLTPSTRYYYRVRAVNQGGSATSNVANAITPDVAPGAPGRLTATAASATQIDLTWANGSGNETGFEIQQSPDGSAWTKLIDVPANTNAYRHEGLRPVTRYYYRVRAVNAIGPSAFSDPASATTLDVPPGVPTNLVARASSFSTIVLTWTNSATNVVGIDIEQSLDGISFRKVGTVGPTATTYTDEGLTPATRYYYRIQAINTVGPSGYSTGTNAITPDVAPVAPLRLTATATSYSAVSLSWGDGSGNETGFEIEQSTDGTTFNRVGTVGANVTSYQQTGLNGSTKYYYRVRAVNAIGPSGYANVADVTTPQAPLPSAPTNLTAVPVEFDLIKLTWSPVSANTTSVVIERSTSSTSGFVEIGQQMPGKTEFGDIGVLPIDTYYYRIKAVNSAGSSDYSNVAKVDAEAIIDAVPEPRTAGHSVYVADRMLFVKAGRPAEATIQIFNLQGLLVLDKRVMIDAAPYQHPVTHLPAGLYIVAVQTAGSTITKKILLP